MRWIGVVVIVIAACGSGSTGSGPDAGGLPIDAPAGCPALPDRAAFDFFGEACDAAPYPANTLCHTDAFGDDHGWCVGPDAGGPGMCRPQAYDDARCPVCPGGTLHYTSGSAAYCGPGA